MQFIQNEPVTQTELPVFSWAKNHHDKQFKETTPAEVFQVLRAKKTEELSEKLVRIPESERIKFRLENFPVAYPNCQTTDGKNADSFSGLVFIFIEINSVRFQEVYAGLARDPNVFLRFTNSFRNKLYVLLLAEYIPQDVAEFHTYFNAAVNYLRGRYQLTDEELALVNDSPTARCFLEYDAQVWSNFFPDPICIAQTTERGGTAPKLSSNNLLDELQTERQQAEQQQDERKQVIEQRDSNHSEESQPGTGSLQEELEQERKKAEQRQGKDETQTIFTTNSSLILEQMLAAVEKVDFRKELAITDPEAKVKQPDTLVIVANQVRKLAESRQWAITLREEVIYLYNGQYWQPLEENQVKHFLSQAAEKMGVRAADTQYYEFKDRLYKQLLSSSFHPISELEEGRVLVNLNNGTFEVNQNGGRLRDFCKKDFLRYQLPFSYDPAAECPRFLAYLNRVLPEKALQDILSEFLGYVFLREPKLEKCLVLYGVGANGKSVFYEVSSALLGAENVLTFGLAHFKHEYNRAALSGKLLNYGSELNAGLENDLFKQIVSVEPLQARLPYGKPFVIRNYAKMAFNANELPRDAEHTEAFFRRLLIVPFDVIIPESERDPDLANFIIRHELAGVFNWVLTGLNRLLKRRAFTESPAVRSAVEQYRKESDTVALFLEEQGYVPSADAPIPLKNFYSEYRAFCTDNGNRPLSQQNFSTRLQRHLGFTVKRQSAGNVVFAKLTDQSV
ncbi:DNA primase family protein [Spirosoma areae]